MSAGDYCYQETKTDAGLEKREQGVFFSQGQEGLKGEVTSQLKLNDERMQRDA